MRRFALPAGLWLLSGAVLAALAGRVADWFVMTDELLYERLALSIVRSGSPLPRVHGVLVGNLNQLYPLVVAPVFASGTIAHGLHDAHILNAFVMASAAIPAYLLAHRLTGNAWASSLAALLTLLVPWITLSSFLLTGVVAYPAFVWALLAFHRAMTMPSRRNDLLALAALVIAVTARTQLVVLALVLAIVTARRRRDHRILVAAYALGAVVLLGALATGHGPLGTYSSTAHGNPFPPSVFPALFSHLAAVAVGLGIVPFVIGGAWLVRRDAFATLAWTTIALVTIETASYDERFGGGIVRDRYVFYLAPVFAIAFAAALAAWERPRWALAVPVALLTAGFAVAPLPVFDKLNADTPSSILDGYLRRELGGLTGARIFFVAVSVVAALLVLEAGIFLGRRSAVLLATLALLLATAQTAYAWERLFRVDGTAGRPLTVDPSRDLAWVDRIVGRSAHVTMLPFPVIAGDYWSSAAYWWDLEFWNVSVDRSAGVPGTFEWTPSTFPKTALRFDGRGRADVSLPGDVLQAVADTRFHLVGTVVTNNKNVFLVQPERPWRADWTTTGLYDDGWTMAGAPARILVYPYPGQDRSVSRELRVSAYAPAGVASRPFTLGGTSAVAGGDQVTVDLTVCVPAARPKAVTLRVDDASQVYGDPATDLTISQPRVAGIQLSRIDLSGAVGPDC